MSSESEIRSRYLALALDARRVIDSLIILVDKREREEGLDKNLEDVIVALEQKDIFSPDRNRLAFSEYYEQVRTVDEALKERGEIIQMLSVVRSNQADIAEQQEDAYKAIQLLSAIESRALFYYRPQP